MELIKALVLEDNVDDAELLILELEESGFEIEWQRVDTQEDFLSSLSPDLDIILADYTLPQFNAVSALELLQGQGYDIPFIVVTGTISDETAVACMKQGAADYLLKDRLSRLGEATRQALTQRDLRREQKIAERELRVMSRAINSSSDAIILTDLRGTITFANGAALSLWKYDHDDDIIGRSLAELWSSDTGRSTILDKLIDEGSVSGEMQSFRSDRTLIMLQYSLSTVLDVDDNPLCLMGIFLDITQQKEAERTRREADMLRIALDKERSLQDLKSRFLSMVVHDFRNPLTVIQLSLSTLRTSIGGSAPDKQLAKIDVSLDEVERLNELMDDVLTVSQLELDASTFNPSENEIVSFCHKVFDACEESMGENHNLKFQSQVASLNIPFDVSLMRRIVVNLMSNATKYSPPDSSIELSLSASSNSFMLEISDEGMGIPEEDLPRIFDTFHRASNSLELQGTGLGLAIVKYAVNLHEGLISVNSNMNKGTTFVVEIPLTRKRVLPGEDLG